ncbi:hypothetical protein Cni_G03193 [Canna indica]|uniref:Uncharacterized protein n=1 Tax=Canna indica TaxID=4628 RepID=A0AAQ3JQU2_9LILI|nr:hypothetical protein Cni_G03193 [Canna indica]
MRRCLGIGSRAKRFFLSSPAKEQPLTWDNPVGRFDLENPEFAGGDEEIFFDSKACLDSDCEDDFFSVNGDYTPSRGNTPDHQTNMQLPPILNGSLYVDKYPDSKSEPSPTSRRKLGDLLQETSQGEQVVNSSNLAEEKVRINGEPEVDKMDADQPSGISSGTPNCSVDSSTLRGEVTPSRDRKYRKGKTWKAGHCCLPSLHSFGFDDKRQKTSLGAYNGS